jgi:hypothetical protein
MKGLNRDRGIDCADPSHHALQVSARCAHQPTPGDWLASAVVWVCGDHPVPLALAAHGDSERAALLQLDARILALEQHQLRHLPDGNAC